MEWTLRTCHDGTDGSSEMGNSKWLHINLQGNKITARFVLVSTENCTTAVCNYCENFCQLFKNICQSRLILLYVTSELWNTSAKNLPTLQVQGKHAIDVQEPKNTGFVKFSGWCMLVINLRISIYLRYNYHVIEVLQEKHRHDNFGKVYVRNFENNPLHFAWIPSKVFNCLQCRD